MKFLIRVGMWSHRRSTPFAAKRYRKRRYIFRPKIDSVTARKRVATYVSVGLRTMLPRRKAAFLLQPAGRTNAFGPRPSGVAGSPGRVPRTRLLERPDDPFRILRPDTRRQLADIGCGINLVVGLRMDSVERIVRRHQDEHELRRVLLEEAREAMDRVAVRGGLDRIDEEQDRSASRDDRGRVVRLAAGVIRDPEVKRPVLVREALVLHLGADELLELRVARVTAARRQRPAPWIAPTTASAKAAVPTSFASGIWRARSYVRTLERMTAFTASRSREAASLQPRYSSIKTPARISAVGLTLSSPAYFGALPWTGSKSAWASPMLAPGATPRPPTWAAAASLR